MTPYSHPILPLLFDFNAARDTVPDAVLPQHPGYPGGAERAQWQVAESIRSFEHYFGVRPEGCWPAEGAINEATLRLLDAARIPVGRLRRHGTARIPWQRTI